MPVIVGAPWEPAPGVENVAELIERAQRGAGLDVRLEVTGERPSRLSDAVSLAAYRIVQESLTNVSRHSAGARVQVNLSFEPGGLAVAVLNGPATDGDGSRSGAAPGVGITGMRERAQAVGGALHAAPLENGFRVDANLRYQLGGA